MHRWTGRKQDLSRFKTFGADAYVHLEPHERENGDKLDPVFAGGDGTYRYMGPEEGVGYDGMGDLILNTKTCTLSSRRNTKLYIITMRRRRRRRRFMMASYTHIP